MSSLAFLAACQKKLSVTVHQSARKTGIKVSGIAAKQSAVFETTVRYGLTAGTRTSSSLPGNLAVEATLELARTEVGGKPVQGRFERSTTLKVGTDGRSAIWKTVALEKGMPPSVEVRVTAKLPGFDLSKTPCGSKVPVVLVTKWSVKTPKGDWRLEGKTRGTAQDSAGIKAFVDCSGFKK